MNAIEGVIPLPMDQAEARVREALAGQGFGVLTEIDLAATLKTRIGVDRAPLKILGACNPNIADAALRIDPGAALLLPCNVVLEPGEAGATRVSIVDPRALMAGEAMHDLAEDAAARLRAALDAAAG
ncbi:MAG: DUF302 domain-containing protein [Acidimicrobiales bacterium]|jgi:uncharacterized protein (DUF302 family)|nr:DUF302 domain-containing protein [Acidimicrobiales bacterium]